MVSLQLETERSSGVTEQAAQVRRFIDEMSALRQTFQSALTVLQAANADLANQKSQIEQEKVELASKVEASERARVDSERAVAERLENAAALRVKAEKELAEVKPLLSDRQARIKSAYRFPSKYLTPAVDDSFSALEKEMMMSEVQFKMDLSKALREGKGGEDPKLKKRVRLNPRSTRWPSLF